MEPADTERLANLAGPFDGHLRQVELRLGVEIANRGNVFRVSGPAAAVAHAEKLLHALYVEAGEEVFDSHAINLRLNAAGHDDAADDGPATTRATGRRDPGQSGTIRAAARTANTCTHSHP